MHSDATASEKVCCRCQQSKPIAQFAIKNKASGQRQSQCRECQKAISRAHYLANKETLKARAAERNARQTDVLRAVVAQALSHAQCACGSRSALTYQVHDDYTGPRVSAVVNAGMSRAALDEAMAHSTVMCKACQGARFGRALVEHMRAVRAGEKDAPPKTPKSEYKRRHTVAREDLRTRRFERESSTNSTH